MADVNGIVLMWAICAVDEKVWTLQEQIDTGDEEDLALADMEDELLSYMKTATDLRVAYAQESQAGSNLPPYEKLVHQYVKKA